MTIENEQTLEDLRFPEEFIFGVATAAYQIEGAVLEDGRGTSIWDTFSHTPGRVLNGDTGDVACDHYHRWKSDLDLMVELGVDAYRFSISWPRLYPQGGGQLNQRGLSFYDRLIDGCLERGLQAYPTLYHWDLPQALADKGGWSNRSTADAFARYAEKIMDKFGDRISAVSTFNEPWCSSILSHLLGIHAPGEKNLDAALAVLHGQHRAHGLAVQAMRASRSSVPLGIVLNLQSLYPATDTDRDQEATQRHETFHNGMFLDPLFKGEYPEDAMRHLGDRMPDGWHDDLATIAQPLDYWGLNYYTPFHIADASSPQADYPATVQIDKPDVPRTDIGWEVDGSTFYDLLVDINARYTLPPCYITENGAAYNHDIVKGVIADQPRIDYLHQHLEGLLAAMRDGVDVRGYFAWSLMDNFEWAEGYDMRFGLIHVDYATQERTFKQSALWYQSLLQQHRG
ncbi:GH1 family beta-glucosidase [Granulosicoccus antarcticus]|uniref:Beta-glucosidase n=1 Tax=Granulosicoccus antarcticus IMCC3135 TaxID=1192854 RepID=A0A2Z2NNN7_9GAMM|nr:GH1 family beta-glucosidase [Granulosicoccus antarcticus]ASJ73026.1 Beta-glucosidase A [Granulosicoccus antarcticus IMCC3135]